MLPVWKGKHNVMITYTIIPPVNGKPQQGLPKMEDLVEYQELCKDKSKSTEGVNSADGDGSGWNWRGSGIIKIGGSWWEILGCGGAEEGEEANEEGEVEWLVTFFFKTAFTPVGMNVYCRDAEGIPPQLTTRICEELLEMEDCRTGRSRMRALSYRKRL
jgi:hypothetical protein